MYKSKIFTQDFVLKLTGLSDIYDVYGNITNLLQKVDLLPFEKYDRFVLLIKKLQNMANTADINVCGCQENNEKNKEPSRVEFEEFADDSDFGNMSDDGLEDGNNNEASCINTEDIEDGDAGHVSTDEDGLGDLDDDENIVSYVVTEEPSNDNKCLWKYYHDCRRQLDLSCKYQGLDFLDYVDAVDNTIRDRTRGQQQENTSRKNKDFKTEVDGKLSEFAIEISKALSDNTFSEEDMRVIEHCRNLTDFMNFQKQIREKDKFGPVHRPFLPIFLLSETYRFTLLRIFQMKK